MKGLNRDAIINIISQFGHNSLLPLSFHGPHHNHLSNQRRLIALQRRYDYHHSATSSTMRSALSVNLIKFRSLRMNGISLYSMLVATLLFVSFRYEGYNVDAVDIAGALKNLGRKSSVDRNAVENLDLSDASTGTITMLAQEKEETTCNDIMAKAVVTANEDKAIAVAEMAAAIGSANEAQKKTKEMKINMEKSISLMETMTSKLEKLEKDKDIVITKANESADLRIKEMNSKMENAERENEITITKANESADLRIKEMNSKMEKSEKEQEIAFEDMKSTVEKSETDRDLAIASSKKTATLQITSMKSEVENIETEKEIAITKANESAELRIKDIVTKSDATMHESIANSNQLVEEANKDVIEAKNNAEALVAQIKNESDARISSNQQQAESLVEKIQKETKEAIEKNNQIAETRVNVIEVDAQKRIDNAQKKQENLEHDHKLSIANITQIATEQVETAKTEANLQIEKISDDYIEKESIINAELQKVREEAEELVMQNSKENFEKVEKANELVKEQVATVHAEKLKVKNDAEINIADAEKQKQKEISQIQAETDEKLKSYKALTESSITEIKNQMKQDKHQTQEIVEKMKQETDIKTSNIIAERKMLESNLTGILLVQNAKVESLTQVIDQHQQQKIRYEREVEQWKDLHNSQSYINTTLVYHDSKDFMQNAYYNIQDHYNTFSTNSLELLSKKLELLRRKIALWYNYASNYASTVTKPYLQKLTEYYEENFAKTVAEVFLPFYKSHIYPVYRNQLIPALMIVQKIAKKGLKETKILCKVLNVSLVDTTQHAAGFILDLVMNNTYFHWAQMFLFAIKFIHDEADLVVIASLKLVALAIIFRARQYLLKLFLFVFFLPWWVIWFFCPLRFFVGCKIFKKIDKKKEEKNQQKNQLNRNVNKR